MGYEVNARTNADGSRFSMFSPESVSTSGLGNLIKCAERLEEEVELDYEEVRLGALLASTTNKYSKYNLAANSMMADYDMSASETVKIVSYKGFRCVRSDRVDVEYREKRGAIVKI